MIPRLKWLGTLAGWLVLTARAEDGASATNWWSFQPARRPALPAVQSSWIRNPVDAFVLARLQTNGLAPSPEAERRTLIRRVTFDLIGLPPTPEEVSAFSQDTRSDSYERLVERLLASPRYGERWARHWLDTVHYGESHGYDKDKPRLHAWRYRDYVIKAFNDDTPYPRFIREQLAADALYPESPALIPALGFIAAGPWDFVGHVELPITKMDGLLARYNDRDDMVMNTLSTFQSLTAHCARCHDHKFDPISQRDYYALQSVFAGVDRADRAYDPDPAVALKRRELTQRLLTLRTTQVRLSNEIASAGGDALRTVDVEIAQANQPARSSAVHGYHSAISSSPDAAKWVQIDLGAPQEIDRVALAGCHDDFNKIGAGFGFPPGFRIEASDEPLFQRPIVILDSTSDPKPNPGIAVQSFDVCRCLTEDGSALQAQYVRVTATRLAPRQGDYIFALAELMVFDSQGSNVARNAKVTALDSIQTRPRWSRENLVDGLYPARSDRDGAGALAELQARRIALIQRVMSKELREAVAKNDQEIAEAQRAESELPASQKVYAAANDFPANGSFTPARTPRPVHLLRRGEVSKRGQEMMPASLASVPSGPGAFQVTALEEEGARRAALARWLTHPDNMLTRRSIVNRIWHYHFGRGLVDTPNDFGRMGSLPSHPELLDWLAFWFVDQGESIKQLHRLLVTSAAYRQSSAGTAASSHPDSANRLLWRMNRLRLDAEQVRDSVLSISGQLDLAMGGASIQQFQFKDDHSPVYDYAGFNPEAPGANRRSIYRFIVRSAPDPLMEALDCPDANLLTPSRNVTMTALQALALLNDALVLRQCEQFARRLEAERPGMEARITRAFELALSRPPTQAEQGKLLAHARKHGLASACRVLFNSNEFLFID